MKELKKLVRMCIYIGEKDHIAAKPLYAAITDLLLREKMAGATVTRCIAGFGLKKHFHTAHLLTLSQDLPIVIECIDSRENMDRILPQLDVMITDGLVTFEPVEATRYLRSES